MPRESAQPTFEFVAPWRGGVGVERAAHQLAEGVQLVPDASCV